MAFVAMTLGVFIATFGQSHAVAAQTSEAQRQVDNAVAACSAKGSTLASIAGLLKSNGWQKGRTADISPTADSDAAFAVLFEFERGSFDGLSGPERLSAAQRYMERPSKSLTRALDKMVAEPQASSQGPFLVYDDHTSLVVTDLGSRLTCRIYTSVAPTGLEDTQPSRTNPFESKQLVESRDTSTNRITTEVWAVTLDKPAFEEAFGTAPLRAVLTIVNRN